MRGLSANYWCSVLNEEEEDEYNVLGEVEVVGVRDCDIGVGNVELTRGMMSDFGWGRNPSPWRGSRGRLIRQLLRSLYSSQNTHSPHPHQVPLHSHTPPP